MTLSEDFKISILLATYNWPQALKLCLESLRVQSDKAFEIIIADDGSSAQTTALIEREAANFPVPVLHLWQEDLGFRKSKILNQALLRATGEYLIFLDADCIVQPDFVAQHRRIARPAQLITGSRILLSQGLTKRMCEQVYIDQSASAQSAFQTATLFALRRVLIQKMQGDINKFLPLLIKLPPNAMRKTKPFTWKRIKGCNLSCWRRDALSVGGLDESFEGWGHEDADFVFRLESLGIQRVSGSFATEVLHLWHTTQPNDNERINRERVMERIKMFKANSD